MSQRTMLCRFIATIRDLDASEEISNNETLESLYEQLREIEEQ